MNKLLRNQRIFAPIFIVGLFFVLLFIFTPSQGANAATEIYRSVGVGGENEIASSTTGTLTIDASGNLTFSGTSMPNRVGVGDAIVYDSDDSNTITAADDIVFIYARASNSAYTVKDQFGANTATTTTGNDTWAVYRAYTSLSKAEASTNNTSILPSYDTWSAGRNISNNATGTNEVWNIACYGDLVDTTAVTIDGWTTAANNYIRVYTPTSTSEVGISQRHNGKMSASAYGLSVNNTGATIIYADHVRIDGLQITISGNGFDSKSFYIKGRGPSNEYYVSNNILKGAGPLAGNWNDGVMVDWNAPGSGTARVWNNIIYNFNRTAGNGFGIHLENSSYTYYVYNNTVYENYYGIQRGNGVVIAKNNLSFHNVDDYAINNHASSTNNAYSEGTDPGSNGLNISVYASTSIFIDPANEDFRLKAGSPVVGMGANLSADPYLPFSTDIQNQARPFGSAWDIGADEYYDIAAPVISDVATSSIAAWTATITWTTDENSTSTVSYGLTTSYGSASSSNIFASSSPSHSITIRNLSPDATYHFRVESTDVYGNRSTSSDYTFHTATTSPATPIYRSVGVGGENELASSTVGTLTIDASGNLTFSGTSMPNRVGVGDAIVYDSNGDNVITAADDIVFIHGRTSNTAYTVKDQFGANTATTTTGNDTWAVYRAYTSLFKAEASTNNTSILPSYDTWSAGRNISNNATGTNEVWNIACYGDAVDTTAVTIGGWTTGLDNYLRIYTPTSTLEVGISQRHNGVLDNNKYKVEIDGSGARPIIVNNNFVRIDGLQIVLTGNDGGFDVYGILAPDVNGIRISSNIIMDEQSGNAAYHTGINVGHSNGENVYVFNNIINGFKIGSGYGIRLSANATSRSYVYNNTVYDCSTGLYQSLSPSGGIIKNNISFENENDYGGLFNASSSNNGYRSAAPSGASNSVNLSLYSSSTIFANPTSNDFRLKAGSPAIGQGTDLSDNADLAFTTDIQGEARTVPWDIGADEYSAPPLEINDIASTTTKTSATITWTTNISATSTIEYGTTTAYGLIISSDVATTNHSLTINNLLASTTYYFKVTVATSTSVSTSTGNFVTQVDMLGLSAAKVVWLKSNRIRVTYDWTDADQIHDWIITRGTTVSQGTSTLSTIGGNTALMGMRWVMPIAASDVYFENKTTLSYINFYTNIASSFDNQNTTPNPSLGHIWTNGDSYWVVNSGYSNYSGSSVTSNTWAQYHFLASSTGISSWSSIDNTWRSYSGSYTLNTSRYVILSTHHGDSTWGKVIIEGDIASDVTKPTISAISSSVGDSSATITWTTNEPANSKVYYGTDVSYSMSSSTSYLSTPLYYGTDSPHTIHLKGLTNYTTYHYQVVTSDGFGNISTSTDRTFVPIPDVAEPIISNAFAFTTPTSTTISWETNESASSTLFYGTGYSFDHSYSPITASSSFSVTLTDLIASTSYHFYINAEDSFGNSTTTGVKSFVTAIDKIGLNAYLSGWLDSNHIRAIYDWSSDDQLLDWTTTPGTTLTRDASTVTVTNGSVSVHAMKWNKLMAASRIYVREHPNINGYLNMYSNLSQAWAGNWDAPSLGHIWYGSGRVYVYGNGSSDYFYNQVVPVNGVWNNYEMLFSTTELKVRSTLDNVWYSRAGTYVPSLTGMIALGGYNDGTSWDFVEIDGAVSPDVQEPVISAMSSTTSATTALISWGTNEISTSSVEYGLTSTYDMSSSSDIFVTAHGVLLKNLNSETTYHFKVTSADQWGNATSSADFVFTTKSSSPATPIYRSVGVGGENELASSTVGTLTIDASGNLTFSGTSMPNRVGVGDAIVYDSNGDNVITAADDIVFIHGRTSNTAYTVKDQFGANTATTTTGNDTWAVYRAYTSLFKAEASTNNTSILPSYDAWSNGRDLTASTGANEVWNIACYGDAVDTTAVDVDGWNTAAHNYIRIYTPTSTSEVGVSQRHNGVWDNSKYRLEFTGYDDCAIWGNTANLKIDGLQIKTITNSGGYWIAGIGSDNLESGDLLVSNNIIQGVINNNNYYTGGISRWGASVSFSLYAWNNIIYGYKGGADNDYRGGIKFNGGRAYLYNNTIFNSNCGVNVYGGSVTIKNNISYENNWDYQGWFTGSSTNNTYYSAAPSGASNNVSLSSYASSSIFVDAVNNDLRVRATSPVVDQGANLSSDSRISFDYDIQNQVRPFGSAWDVGADEYYDTTGPIISVVSSSTGINSAFVTWTTDEDATSTVYYGISASYDYASTSNVLASSTQSMILRNLIGTTTYHFMVVATDALGNQASSTDYVFTTKSGGMPDGFSRMNNSEIENGWEQPSGATDIWSIANNKLQAQPTGSYAGGYIYRPSSEISTNTQVSVDFNATDLGMYPQLILRATEFDTTPTGYLFAVSNNGSNVDGAGIIRLIDNSWTQVWSTTGTAVANHNYRLIASAVTNGAQVDLNLRVLDLDNSNAEIINLVQSDTDASRILSAGRQGLSGSGAVFGTILYDNFEVITLNSDTIAPVISNVATSSITASTAVITWTTDENSTSTVRYGLTSTYGSASSSNIYTSSTHSIRLISLAANTTYHYRVESTDASGNRATSTDKTFMTNVLPDLTAPTVDSFAIPATSNSLLVSISSFTASDNVAVTGYLVNESASAPALSDPAWETMTTTTYLFASAGSKTLYAWARDAAGNISSSLNSSVTITIPTYTVSGTISGLTGTVVLRNNGGDDLSVVANGSFTFATALNNGASYIVTVATNPSGQTCTVSSGSGTISGAVSNVSVVCANNVVVPPSSGGGGGGGSPAPVIPVADTIPPGVVNNFVASSSDRTITLSWSNPIDIDFAGVKLYHKLGSALTSHLDPAASVIYTGKAQKYIDANLTNNQIYYYSIYAFDTNNNYSTVRTVYATAGSGQVPVVSPPVIENPDSGSGSSTGSNSVVTSLIGANSALVNQVTYDEAANLLANAHFVELTSAEKTIYLKMVALATKPLSDQAKVVITYFIHAGTPTTRVLGAGERGGTIASFRSAFGYLPETLEDWQDTLKIGNGRWPKKQSPKAEAAAKIQFKKIYLREPNMKQANDNAAVTVMAYGLRPALRNTNSEKVAIKAFKYYYNVYPTTAANWDVVRAIAYSGAKR